MYVCMYVCMQVYIYIYEIQNQIWTTNFIGRYGDAMMRANNGFSFRTSNIANNFMSKLYLRKWIFSDSKTMQFRYFAFFFYFFFFFFLS